MAVACVLLVGQSVVFAELGVIRQDTGSIVVKGEHFHVTVDPAWGGQVTEFIRKRGDVVFFRDVCDHLCRKGSFVSCLLGQAVLSGKIRTLAFRKAGARCATVAMWLRVSSAHELDLGC